MSCFRPGRLVGLLSGRCLQPQNDKGGGLCKSSLENKMVAG